MTGKKCMYAPGTSAAGTIQSRHLLKRTFAYQLIFEKINIDPPAKCQYRSDDQTEVKDLSVVGRAKKPFSKCEWLNREILTWENIKPLYVERDFSQANLIDKLQKLLEREEYKALKMERVYYRSRNRQPFDYRKLAGE